MFNGVEGVIKFLFDKTIGWGKKLFAIIIVLCGFYLLDGVLGISKFSFTNKKVETISKLHSLLKDTTLDIAVRKSLTDELASISKEKSLQEDIYRFFSVDDEKKIKRPTNKKVIPKENSIKSYNYFISFISATGVFIIAALISFFANIKTRNGLTFLQYFLYGLLGNIFVTYFIFLLINAMPLLPISSKYSLNIYINHALYQLGILGFITTIILHFHFKKVKRQSV